MRADLESLMGLFLATSRERRNGSEMEQKRAKEAHGDAIEPHDGQINLGTLPLFSFSLQTSEGLASAIRSTRKKNKSRKRGLRIATSVPRRSRQQKLTRTRDPLNGDGVFSKSLELKIAVKADAL
jgi:hypothetical protein